MIEHISKWNIDESLKDNSRQYLAGDLANPQRLNYIQDQNIEVGITRYQINQSEKGHYHTKASEYHLMISGYTKYLDVESNKEFEFRKGDFYVIRPFTRYLQKSKKGTEILFFKFPAGNDKVPIAETKEIDKWLADSIKTVRIDHYHSIRAPQPNSIKPAVAVCVEKEGQILFVKRKDSMKWTLPGGTHDFGESLADTAVREMKEEVGYDIEIETLIGTYTDPGILIEYNDGEVRQEFTFVYLGKIIDGTLIIDEESVEARWVSITDVSSLQMAESQRRRIKDVIQFFETKRTHLR